MKPLRNNACECEHADHFPATETTRKTHAHHYGCVFLPKWLARVRTLFGVHRLCPACTLHHTYTYEETQTAGTTAPDYAHV